MKNNKILRKLSNSSVSNTKITQTAIKDVKSASQKANNDTNSERKKTATGIDYSEKISKVAVQGSFFGRKTVDK